MNSPHVRVCGRKLTRTQALKDTVREAEESSESE